MSTSMIGQYQIVELLGEGGMGQVFRAFDPKMQREVALKVISPALIGNIKAVERFQRELQVLVSLQAHPNIVTVFDYVDEPFAVVMEMMHGETLDAYLARQPGPLPLPKVLAHFKSILQAVGFAHEKGILHRDIKSSNAMVVYLGSQEVIKVMDFGLAGFLGGPSGLTRAGARMGTPAYMAPEQHLGRAVDERSDLYALGILLFEMLTGRLPFCQSTLSDYELARAHIEGEMPLPSALRPDLSRSVDQIVLRATQKAMERRYGSAAEFLADIERVEAVLPVDYGLVASAPAPVPVPAAAAQPPVAPAASAAPAAAVARPTVLEEPAVVMPVAPSPLVPDAPRRPRIPAIAWVGGLVGAVAVAGIVAALVLGREPADPATAPPAPPPTPPVVTPQPQPPIAIDWVTLPGGRFAMGSSDTFYKDEVPIHWVDLKPFQMARTEVTWAQYNQCVRAGVCSPAHVADGVCHVWKDGKRWTKGILPDRFLGEDQPAVCLEWDQARTFARWAGGRLPSEAEWEYAAKSAGKDRRFPWGDQVANCQLAMMDETDATGVFGCGAWKTSPVCTRAGRTDQGLCDVAGNAWEMVEDLYHASYDSAPADGSPRLYAGTAWHVARGGGWASPPKNVRTTRRDTVRQGSCDDTTGFRLARTL